MLKMLKETMDYSKKSKRTMCGEMRKISREMKNHKRPIAKIKKSIEGSMTDLSKWKKELKKKKHSRQGRTRKKKDEEK